ncbi:transposase [Streptomyces decoyicus]
MWRSCAVRRRCRIPDPSPRRPRSCPAFLTWCADSDIPEVRQLAITVDRWWLEVEAFIDPGYSNAKSEGINRVIKLVARERSASATSFPSSFMGVRHFPSRRRDAAPWYSTSLSERPVRALSGAAVPDLCSCSALPHRGRIGEHRLHLSGGRPVA